jgi:hypothetical protein
MHTCVCIHDIDLKYWDLYKFSKSWSNVKFVLIDPFDVQPGVFLVITLNK